MTANSELLEVIGRDALIDLANQYAGTRLYVPANISAEHEIATTIGHAAAVKLAARFGPDVIRVPLARALRASRYREQGLTNARIAVRLGMTEPGVNRLIRALTERDEVEPRMCGGRKKEIK